ncbi:MAG: hypothetical protein HY961_04845 [Ignavibacteriae bacterium]|nr:hypothetical protein [Ignavibacteriota bacterium]
MQYVVDRSGKSNFLIVRRKDWEDIHAKYRKLQKKLEVFQAIREGIQEVKFGATEREATSIIIGLLG